MALRDAILTGFGMQFIDNLDFAKKSQVLEAKVCIGDLARASDLLDGLSGELNYKLTGGKDSQNRATLDIEICGIITALCQSCLTQVSLPVHHIWTVTIFNNETDQMHALFSDAADCADGILADPEFDVLGFIEDEIIMLLPISPRHELCEERS